MSKQTQALKLALEALEEINKLSIGENAICLPAEIDTAMDAIREALAEQPQEPEQSEIFCGVDFADGLLSVSVLRRRADDVAELLHLEQIALPAQQQEPVAYASDVEFDDETEIIPAEQKGKLGTAGLRIPLYIKPPASKPLTDEEIETAMPSGIYDCLADPWDCGVGDGNEMRSIKKDVLRIARAVEAAHDITGEQK